MRIMVSPCTPITCPTQTASRPASGNIFTASQARLPIYGYYFINYKLYIDVIRLVFDNTRHHGKQGKLHRSEEHTSELQSRENLVCRLLLEKKKKKQQ